MLYEYDLNEPSKDSRPSVALTEVEKDNKLLTGIINGIINNENLYQTVYFYGDEDKVNAVFMEIIDGYKKRNPEKCIIKVNALDFVYELIFSIKNDYSEELIKAYHACDVFMMDHFDRIGIYVSAMEVFYELFDYHFIRGRQIIIAGSVQPRLIEGLPNRVRTQLEGGIMCHTEKTHSVE